MFRLPLRSARPIGKRAWRTNTSLLSSYITPTAAVTLSTSRAASTKANKEQVVEAAVNNILYNTPKLNMAKPSRRVLTALVNNEPGVLSRIAGVLAARGFNIDSLVVGETEVKQLSRTTLVLESGQDVEQVKKQLEDVVQVWAVVEYPADVPILERELLLIKISCAGNLTPEKQVHPFMGGTSGASRDELRTVIAAQVQRASIVELTALFGGNVVDVAVDHIIVEVTAKASRIDAFIELVRPFGITECARTGALVMLRGSTTGFEDPSELEEEDATEAFDATMLPPG